jgi:pyruvate kinase
MSSKRAKLNSTLQDQYARITVDVTRLRDEAVRLEQDFASDLKQIRAPYFESARNLVHYLALRRKDLRTTQLELQRLGLSSLGRMEANVLPTLNAVLTALNRLSGSSLANDLEPMPDPRAGDRLLKNHTTRMFGSSPKHRSVRIMVTMPSQAANDDGLIGQLLEFGMDIMRINCAHDSAETWSQMLEHRRTQTARLGRMCRVVFDLAGPKLRTDQIVLGPEVIKIKPTRDALGRVTVPARVMLTNSRLEPQVSTQLGLQRIPVETTLLEHCQPGDHFELTDARGRARRLEVIEVADQEIICATDRTIYLTSQMPIRLHRKGKHDLKGHIGSLSAIPQFLKLTLGDVLILTREAIPGENARLEAGVLVPAHIACTLPEVFNDVQVGQRIFFDDGKIAGLIRKVGMQQLEVEVTHLVGSVAKLRAEKGINLPDTHFHLSALSKQDLEDLKFIVEHGDMVSLSFVRSRQDIEALIAELERLGGGQIGIVLKIENRSAFENLPELLLAALKHPPVAVMIARGDLGVEIGFERLAEVQEEILWLCEAAHVPVIWATQVLESLANQGLPTRAEVTDAAMSARAECVMLNKGPYIVEAVSFLDNVLRRMKSHQNKKTSMMRRLKVTS